MKIFISGMSTGIGKALVKKFIREGNEVWGIARREKLLTEFARELDSKDFFWSGCDVTDKTGLYNLKKEMEEKNFFPDVVISCAAIFDSDIEPVYSRAIFDKTMEINFSGAINLVDLFLPEMVKRKNGHFIALSSISAFRPSIRRIAYSASKAALGISFRGFNLAYNKQGVVFSTLYLGPVATDMWQEKKSFLVTTADNIAGLISKVIKTRKAVYYLPFIPTAIFRLTSIFSDELYSKLTGPIRKKTNHDNRN